MTSTLFDQFAGTCDEHPHHIAYEGRGRVVSYAEMYGHVLSADIQLGELGVRRGDRVVVSSAPPYQIFVLELACSRRGATLVFLESFMAPNGTEWNDAVAGSAAHWAVTWSPEGEARWERTGVAQGDAPAGGRAILLQARTSGTSGPSKGVCIAEEALLHAVRNTREVAQCSSRSRGMLLYEPLGLISQIAAFSTLLSGATLVDALALAATPAGIPAFIEQHRITHAVMVPQHIGAALSDPDLSRRDLGCLEVVMYGAAPVTRELMQRARAAIRCRWLQCYGMTETTGPVCWLSEEEQSLAGMSVGRAAPGCRIRICDIDSGEALPAGSAGEVQVAGPLLMEGYWDPVRKCPMPGDRLVEGWLRTGDLGLLDASGRLTLRGRATDEIVCALGYTLKPADIEAAVQELPDVLETCALGYEMGDIGVVAVAVCQVRDDDEGTRRRVHDAFCRNLDASKRPGYFLLTRQALPRGPNGKVHKALLKTLVQPQDLIAV